MLSLETAIAYLSDKQLLKHDEACRAVTIT